MQNKVLEKLSLMLVSVFVFALIYAVPSLASEKTFENVPISGLSGASCDVSIDFPSEVSFYNEDRGSLTYSGVAVNSVTCKYSKRENNVYFLYEFKLSGNTIDEAVKKLSNPNLKVAYEGVELSTLNPNIEYSVSNIKGVDISGVPSAFTGKIAAVDSSVRINYDSTAEDDIVTWSYKSYEVLAFNTAGSQIYQITQPSSSSGDSSSGQSSGNSEVRNNDDDDAPASSSTSSGSGSWTPAPASAAATRQQTASTQLASAQSSLTALSVIPYASKQVFRTSGMALNMTSVNTVDANTSKLLAANNDIPYNITFMFMGRPMICTVPVGFNYAQYSKPDGTMNIHEVLWAVYSNQLRQQTRQRSSGRR